MKNIWGIFVILAVLTGMFYFYSSLNRQPASASPENSQTLQAGNVNEGLSAAETLLSKNLDLDSLSGLEAELTPLEELQETL